MSSRKRSTTKSRPKPVKAIIVGNADDSSTDSDLSDTDDELASFENMSRAPSLDEVALAKALWKTKVENFEAKLETYTTKELREKVKSRGLKVSGTKSALVDRLVSQQKNRGKQALKRLNSLSSLYAAKDADSSADTDEEDGDDKKQSSTTSPQRSSSMSVKRKREEKKSETDEESKPKLSRTRSSSSRSSDRSKDKESSKKSSKSSRDSSSRSRSRASSKNSKSEDSEEEKETDKASRATDSKPTDIDIDKEEPARPKLRRVNSRR